MEQILRNGDEDRNNNKWYHHGSPPMGTAFAQTELHMPAYMGFPSVVHSPPSGLASRMSEASEKVRAAGADFGTTVGFGRRMSDSSDASVSSSAGTGMSGSPKSEDLLANILHGHPNELSKQFVNERLRMFNELQCSKCGHRGHQTKYCPERRPSLGTN